MTWNLSAEIINDCGSLVFSN